MPRLHHLFRLVFGLVRGVIRLDLGIADLGLAAGQLRGGERHILDLPRLRNRQRVPGRGLLEIRLQVRVARVDGLLQVVQRYHGVVELNLRPLHLVCCAHRRIGHGDSAGDQRLQALQFQVLLHLPLEVSLADVLAHGHLNEVDVPVVADILPVGEQVLRQRPGAQIGAQVVVRHLQVQPVGLLLQDRALHQGRSHPIDHQGQQLTHHRIGNLALLHLLLQLPLRQPGNVLHLDGRGLPEDPAHRPRRMHRRIGGGRVRSAAGIHQPGNQVCHHGNACDADDDAEHNLDNLIVLLKETNHA